MSGDSERIAGKPEVIQRRGGAKPIWTLARLCGSSKNTSAGTSRWPIKFTLSPVLSFNPRGTCGGCEDSRSTVRLSGCANHWNQKASL